LHHKLEGRRPLTGVMIGRAAMNTPVVLAETDTRLYGMSTNPHTAYSRRSVAEGYLEYLDTLDSKTYSGRSLFQYLKPLVGLCSGQPGNRLFRSTLDTLLRDKSQTSPSAVLTRLIDMVDEALPELLDSPLVSPQSLAESPSSSQTSSGSE